MAAMMEYPLANGGTIVVEVEGTTSEVVTRGWGDARAGRVLEQANETFESALTKVRSAADAMVDSLTGLRSIPDEVTVEFAVQLSAEAGAVITSIGSTANFKVALTWKPLERVAQSRDSDRPGSAD